MDEKTLKVLFDGLKHRTITEKVALTLSKTDVSDLPAHARADLSRLAQAGLRWFEYEQSTSRPYYGDFASHPGLPRAASSAFTLLAAVTDQAPAPVDPSDPQALESWLASARALLGLGEPSGSFKRTPSKAGWGYGAAHSRRAKAPHADVRTRMNAAERKVALPGVSVRAYRKAVRAVVHLEERTALFKRQKVRESATRYGKSRLASLVEWDDFKADASTAAFVAYYTSRLNAPTVFTFEAQARPMDDLAQALLERALKSPTCRYDVLAMVLTRQNILAGLDDEARGRLLGLTFEQMRSAASFLGEIYDSTRRDMVVRRGDDSSSWNATTRAYNQARTGWLNLTRSMGLSSVAELLCPGKIPAMIAADVYYWHASTGGASHGDEAVFAALPKPWDVLAGAAVCTSSMVEAACTAAGVDPKEGWLEGYRQSGLEDTKVTPVLVHGVEVSSPALGETLKKLGVFA